jgi:hypothetical protein
MGGLLLVGAATAVVIMQRVAPSPSLNEQPSIASRPSHRSLPAAPAPVELPAGVTIDFADATSRAGINFQHFDGPTEMEYIMETTGSGVAWLDYDGDGWMDLFLVQGATFVGPKQSQAPTCKLFKNLGPKGGFQFRDVTEQVGLCQPMCGQGVAVGDIDNDGFPDLFITCFGEPNRLYRNVSDGKGGRKFFDITSAAGLAQYTDWRDRPNYSTSAAFLDYDNDGKLDLFVCSYVRVDLAHYPECVSRKSGRRYSCQPSRFEPTRCLLYRNRGDGTFEDVSHAAGIDDPRAKALGVVALDVDDDGRIDLFVANDGLPNFLFRNRGDGRFESIGPMSGCAVNLNGARQAYMGVDADDLDGDGRPDLFVTAFSQETNTYFRNEGGCRFLDVTQGSGLGPPSWPMLGFGTCFLDVDNDGSLDIMVANGHVSRQIDAEGLTDITFRQKAQLFRNRGRGVFDDVTAQVGAYFQQGHVGRGLASCDYDNDGKVDVAVSNNGEAAALLHNESRMPYHWIRLELHGTRSNRDAIGAKVALSVAGRQLVRHRKGGGSYMSSSDPRLHVGLGTATKVERIEVRWPSGLVQHFGPQTADRGYIIVEGRAEVQVAR